MGCYRRPLIGYSVHVGLDTGVRVLRVSAVCAGGELVPLLDGSFPNHMVVEDSSMWSRQTIPRLDCFPLYMMMAVLCDYPALVGMSESRIGKRCFATYALDTGWLRGKN
ncbi:hypothetical protein L3X38_026107 [Prunus dulcis]|uniref:Uncharacterized protein n=1 Tax=Prunus dulcis TaxID=3755 RepID=A0AAD4W347_PRUDU|nr:hypothetical protein L3X38_026107 [Prunus dulcis]